MENLSNPKVSADATASYRLAELVLAMQLVSPRGLAARKITRNAEEHAEGDRTADRPRVVHDGYAAGSYLATRESSGPSLG